MRALVLSGGGSHGAFEVGVIKRLAELGHSWDIICGVSAGSLNALNMACYAQKDQLQGAIDLEVFWTTKITGNGSVYNSTLLPIDAIQAIFGRGGLYDTSPLEKLLRSVFDIKKLQASNIIMRLGAANLRTGQIDFGTQFASDPVIWAMASSAFPVMFPPVRIGSDKYIDGGVRNTTPIKEALNLGATDLDIVMADPQSGESLDWDQSQAGNVIQVALRAASIMANEVFVTDPDVLANLVGNVTYKIYSPLAPWTIDPLTFDPTSIAQMIDVGYGIP